jgi:16S rRNA (guanine966-N2)-methyltransferase
MAKKFARRAARQRGTRARPARARNELRIIGGAWRGRRIRFAPIEGLRPSPDRVRETLFNWLRDEVVGSRCLDLFAGSGALGVEALSRGASETVFVEREPTAVRELEANLALLGATAGKVVQADALQFLRGPPRSFDIVFLDPPFASGRVPEVCALLASGGWLAPGALIYIEQSAREALDGLPAGWTLVRSKRAGEVGYHLVRRSP